MAGQPLEQREQGAGHDPGLLLGAFNGVCLAGSGDAIRHHCAVVAAVAQQVAHLEPRGRERESSSSSNSSLWALPLKVNVPAPHTPQGS
jgi:hypothetical protein